MFTLLTIGLLSLAAEQDYSAPVKFHVGQHVAHAAGSTFPAGTGTIFSVTPWNTGDGFSYKVRCDKTGKVLPVNFKESELGLFRTSAQQMPVGAPQCVPAASTVTSTTYRATTSYGTSLVARKHRLRDFHPFQRLRSRLRGC